MKRLKQEIIELNRERIEALLRRAQRSLKAEDYQTVKAVFESYTYLTELVDDKRTTIARLRKLLFGARTEKTRVVIPEKDEDAPASAAPAPDDDATPSATEKEERAGPQSGHGRHGAADYAGAERIRVPHAALKSGDPCPECHKGRVCEVARPGVLIRITGTAPVQAKVYELQKLRCNLCGQVFTAAAPEGISRVKYDATAASMIALLKYGSGLPFNRLERLQGGVGLPLPASTQWEIVRATAAVVAPVYAELIRQAAQGEVLYNDDTTIKILEFMGRRAKQAALAEGGPAGSGKKNASGRSGLFTSGIVATSTGRRMALFFSGHQHAGENLAAVLAQRAQALAPPIQMCDALSRNLPAACATRLANCLAHGRRQFVDVAERFPEACRHVLEVLREVYRNDTSARKRGLSPAARRQFHQDQSGPILVELRQWCHRQFEERWVEPNSALGVAITYLLRHWEKLTLFLREPGAPLDNNLCEQVLKRAILHRKNALFYKTLNGAHVGDLFMSLIHTCQLNDVNPFAYLTALQHHAADLATRPENWMPWNYQDTGTN